jgi:peptide/nickel transport system permease protein
MNDPHVAESVAVAAEHAAAHKPGGTALVLPGSGGDISVQTLWGDVWRRLRKNKLAILGTAIILTLGLVAIFAPLIAPYDPALQNLPLSLRPPSAKHWFGTDILGRDYFSRVVYGSRISISIGMVATSISLAIGLTMGALAGYFGKWVDGVISRLGDVFFAFPFIVGVIIVLVALGNEFPRLLAMFIAIGLFNWASVARLFRASILQVKEADYVEAARALGAGHFRILTRHVIPNALAPVIVFAMISTGTVILVEAALSFLGFGVSTGNASWGYMVSQGKSYMTTQPWLVMFPGLGIVITVLGFIFVGDGLRDSMDPRLR